MKWILLSIQLLIYTITCTNCKLSICFFTSSNWRTHPVFSSLSPHNSFSNASIVANHNYPLNSNEPEIKTMLKNHSHTLLAINCQSLLKNIDLLRLAVKELSTEFICVPKWNLVSSNHQFHYWKLLRANFQTQNYKPSRWCWNLCQKWHYIPPKPACKPS